MRTAAVTLEAAAHGPPTGSRGRLLHLLAEAAALGEARDAPGRLAQHRVAAAAEHLKGAH